MVDGSATNSPIVAAYRERTKRSAALAAEAQQALPSGITHDSRYLEPYGLYVERASGARKWDVDGNEYVDYFGGHGALLLGHGHPAVLAAAHAALDEGTQFGASHAREIGWARAVQRLVPSAERVRFTASGTEATLLALRLARAATGRRKIVRFKANFHGWHDHMTSGYLSHFDGSPTPGVLPEVAGQVVLLPPGDGAAAAETFAADDDIAAVIVEPTGGSFGLVPIAPAFLHELRALTARHGIVLIFDEVISGFRVAPGGAQGAFDIRPDLSTFAKILAGGLPGGAVAGRRDLLDGLDFAAMRAAGREKIDHPGTFNANPVSAAAGIATLGLIEKTDACARANATAEALRARLNEELALAGVAWAVYGSFSGFHIFTNPEGRDIAAQAFDPTALDYAELKRRRPGLVDKLRLALLVNGVDIGGWPGGLTSAAHEAADVARTAEAFREALAMLRREGEV